MENRHRVLVIDDSTTYLKILKTYLERAGYEVFTAESGESGIQLLSKEPHLILCDYLLPGMKGDEVCKQVKLNYSSRNIPIIMLTARGEQKAITNGLDAGADDYILKSDDLDILLLRVKNFLRGNPEAARNRSNLVIHRQKVLTIEDDKFYRTHLSRILADEGYEVYEAAGGLEGLQAVNHIQFDLILVDFIMPGMPGDEVCRELKSRESLRDIPVILLTSRGDKNDMVAGLNAGADDYIVKTSDTEVLKSRVKALIRRKFYQDENRRIQEELRAREVEAERAKSERDLAQVRARLADELETKNRSLEDTNRKFREAQTALVQAEKLAALGQLVAGIAHEINNPLAFVSNNLITIERDARDISQAVKCYRELFSRVAAIAPEASTQMEEELLRIEEDFEVEMALKELSNYLADAREGLERVKNIVVNLRNFSRLDEGDIKTVDIVEGIESTLKIIGHLIKGRIKIERDYCDAPRVECYPGLLNQVFMNLLVNACQAIPGEGTIRIRTYVERQTVRVAIADTGCGIPPQIMEKIFDPFFTTKEVGAGTGLGLSTSYGIMQKHGGRIAVESTPGIGSTFTVVLHLTLPKRMGANGQE